MEIQHITPEELALKKQTVITLYRAELFIRQAKKGFRELQKETILFSRPHSPKLEVDSDVVKIATGIAWGAFDNLKHDNHDKTIAKQVIQVVQAIPDEDLYLNL